MTLEPLLNAGPVIQTHAFAALGAFALGVVQLAAPKGTLPHRTIGWIWVALLAAIAISSFWIHGIRMLGPFSLIHVLSIYTLFMLPVAVLSAHRHDVGAHKRAMVSIFFGALVIAGAFTPAAGPGDARRGVRALSLTPPSPPLRRR
jgi:uncharacterized membrane protein